MNEDLVSPEELSAEKIDESEHIIYYTFLRPSEQEYDSLIRPKKGITVSRTLEEVCSSEELQFYTSQVAKEQPIIKGVFDSIKYFGKDKDIPVLTIESEGMESLHRRMMTYLLLVGSPYEGDFLHKGHYDIRKLSGSYHLTGNQYTPHLTIDKTDQEMNLTQLLGKEFSCKGIFSRVKRFGIWDDDITYHPFPE